MSFERIKWVNLIFFIITAGVAVVAAPYYLYHFDLSVFDLSLFAFYCVVTGMSITVGYHRLYAHKTYEANPVLQFFILFFGAAAFEQSALDWASQHRDHHRYVDTDKDPYDIKKGFWFAHIGWLIYGDHKTHYENVKDLQKNSLLMNQSKYYHYWAVGSGILLPAAIGAIGGHFWAAVIFTVCVRLTLVYHATFCINSVCHMFGKATYDIYASAKDHWFVAVITYGEGYHNFHHRFPADYRNGVRWYQWDPSKWAIFVFLKSGFVYNVKRISRFRVMEAKLEAQNRRVNDHLELTKKYPQIAAIQAHVVRDFEKLKQYLAKWDGATKAYQDMLKTQSKEILSSAKKQMLEAKENFTRASDLWALLIKREIGFAVSI